MNVQGERVLIFGDSLSHHGDDYGPEIWDVNAGSSRATSAPGDILASLLLEQGASAVRIDANVGRSARNFWTAPNNHQKTPATQLIALDQAFAPTKVIVMLGTNDADAGAMDVASITQIRDTYAAMGAEIWAVGPPVFADARLTNNAVKVYDTMAQVFGADHLIDSRPISSTDYRTSDGVHFQAAGARPFANALANQLVTTYNSAAPVLPAAPPNKWVGAALAFGGVLALGLIWMRFRDRKVLGLGAPRKKKVPGTRTHHDRDDADLTEAEFKRKYPEQHFAELIRDPDPASMEVAQDWALENGIKLSKLKNGFTLSPLNPADGPLTRVTWMNTTVKGDQYDHVAYEVWFKGRAFKLYKALPRAKASRAKADRKSSANAWALAKALKNLPASAAETSIMDIQDFASRVLNVDNSKPKELFGPTPIDIVDGKRWGKAISPATAGYRPIDCTSDVAKRGLARCWSKQQSKQAPRKQLQSPESDGIYSVAEDAIQSGDYAKAQQLEEELRYEHPDDISLVKFWGNKLPVKKLPSYKAKRLELFDDLAANGWKTSMRSLKIPWAETPDKRVRFWFHRQSIWYSSAYEFTGNQLLTPPRSITSGFDMRRFDGKRFRAFFASTEAQNWYDAKWFDKPS